MSRLNLIESVDPLGRLEVIGELCDRTFGDPAFEGLSPLLRGPGPWQRSYRDYFRLQLGTIPIPEGDPELEVDWNIPWCSASLLELLAQAKHAFETATQLSEPARIATLSAVNAAVWLERAVGKNCSAILANVLGRMNSAYAVYSEAVLALSTADYHEALEDAPVDEAAWWGKRQRAERLVPMESLYQALTVQRQ